MIPNFMHIRKSVNVAIQPIRIISATKGGQECIAIGEDILLTGVFDIMKYTGLYIIKWITVDRSVIK